MFEHLVHFRAILVTGPQRSGTTIAARMIAHDTGLTFHPEEDFGTTQPDRWKELVRDSGGVIQCPAMCRYVHLYGQDDDVAVVMIWRPVLDIIASQKRIGWDGEPDELAAYGVKTGSQAVVKYGFWIKNQQQIIKHNFDIGYEDLAAHPLWIGADQRAKIKPRQTTFEP